MAKLIDMTGQKYGKLTVIKRIEDNVSPCGYRTVMWLCKCDCGNTRIMSGKKLRKTKEPSCGCDKKQNFDERGHIIKGKPIVDYTGRRFGKLTVIGLDRIENKISWWNVKCDCGTIKSVRGNSLPILKSCGCQKREQDLKNIGVTDFNHHQLTNHPVYSIWSGMKTRCENKNAEHYKDYGGRGIKICDEWKDLRNFAKWADETGFEPGKNFSIERKNVNGDYCPENCVWIDRKLQTHNCRNTRRLTINGETKPLIEWAEIYGIDYKTVSSRYTNGYREPEDLFYKGSLINKKAIRIKVRGELLTIPEASKKYGVSKYCIWQRYEKGIRDGELLISKEKIRIKENVKED